MASNDEYQQRQFFELYPLHKTKIFKQYKKSVLDKEFELVCSVCKRRIIYCGGCKQRSVELIEIKNN